MNMVAYPAYLIYLKGRSMGDLPIFSIFPFLTDGQIQDWGADARKREGG